MKKIKLILFFVGAIVAWVAISYWALRSGEPMEFGLLVTLFSFTMVGGAATNLVNNWNY